MEDRRCPHCGAVLNEDNIQSFTIEVIYYNLYLYPEDDLLRYEPEEPESNEIENEGFCCRKCGFVLALSEDEVKEILKSKEE